MKNNIFEKFKTKDYFKKLLREYLPLLLLLMFALPSIWYLFIPGFISTDDGNWMVIRFSAFYQTFIDWQIPVRFLDRLNYGFGYPVANFLYPGFMYIALPFKAIGFSYADSIKIILGGSMIASAVFIYLWLKNFFSNWEPFFGSLFYIYAPYHLFDITRRGSVGEVLALAVVPFLLWQIEKKNLILASLSFAFLLISHNTLAVLFAGLVLLYMSANIYAEKDRGLLLKLYFKILIFAISISAFFTFPALFELPFTKFSQIQISEYSKYFADYKLIGITTIVIILLAIVSFLRDLNLVKKFRMALLMIVISIFSIFFAIPLSDIFWQILPVAFIQFPFRMLSVALVSVSFLAAFVISLFPSKYKIALALFITVLTVIFSSEFLRPTHVDNFPDGFYSTNESTTTVHDEYMPIWVDEKPFMHYAEKVKTISGEGEISNLYYDSKKISFFYNSITPSVLEISTIYYPGWKAFSEGRQKAIFYDNPQGLMQLKTVEGSQRIELTFTETPLRLISDLISVAGLIILLLYNYNKVISKKIKILKI